MLPNPLMGTATPFWAQELTSLLTELGTSERGLAEADARERLARVGPNVLRPGQRLSRLRALWAQIESPLVLLLIGAAALSLLTGEFVDATIVLLIVVASVVVSFRREYQAQAAAAALARRLGTLSTVLRDGAWVQRAVADLVPGDLVRLQAGTLVPADARLIDAKDLFVSEAALTGESFPAEKRTGVVAPAAAVRERSNCVFVGTNVRSGTALAVVVTTGASTEFGHIAERLSLRPPETEFDRGLRRFGQLLTVAMLVMVVLVFAAHMLGGRPPVDTLLFAIALAVGLSPELLPAILSVNLARSAEAMARHGVLVRHLNAIENLGSLDVLCTDKTGTLTEGVVRLEGAFDAAGASSPEVLRLGRINAAFETGIKSPLDEAIVSGGAEVSAGWTKLGELPFDFNRKRVSVIVKSGTQTRLIVKGAFHHVLPVCVGADVEGLERRYAAWSAAGVRVLAVASKAVDERPGYGRDDESGLTFEGFLTFLDRPRADVRRALDDLNRLGVTVKLITGDNALVARHVAEEVGLTVTRVLTGHQLDELHDEALWRDAERTQIFAEVDPNQKERIILALKKMGHVVGFMGDGVNDAPAMHAADTSISVMDAVDVAKEAADFVLLEQSLDVIRRGIEEGRTTFANTLKYVLTTTSANLGNMVSMALASLVLPFLPLTAGQILLNNLLSDIPAIGLATDAVDGELVAKPRRWDLKFIFRFMLQFGLLSSLMDLLTFAALLLVFHSPKALFQTGWFVESLLTELFVALVVRTRRPLYASRPGRTLLWLTGGVAAVALLIPYLPGASWLGFVPMPWPVLGALVAITALYVVLTEFLKRWFFRRGSWA